MYLQERMQSVLHSKHRAGVSQGRNTDQALTHFPPASSLLAASGRGQRDWDRECPGIPRGIPARWVCGVSTRLSSELHQEFSCLPSAWDHRWPHKTLPLGRLHIPPALKAYQAVAISRRIQLLYTSRVKPETLYHRRVLHLHLLSICLHLKGFHSASSAKTLAALILDSLSMTASSSSHEAIPSSTVNSNVFPLASQQSFL